MSIAYYGSNHHANVEGVIHSIHYHRLILDEAHSIKVLPLATWIDSTILTVYSNVLPVSPVLALP